MVDPREAPAACFHCGEPVPIGADYAIHYQQHSEPACCLGCQAVAQTIIESGNADYYRLRTELPKTPEEALDKLRGLKLYDLPEVQRSFVKTEGEVLEANLILEGIVCAACVWLNEHHLYKLPGVLGVDINYTTRRARIRWDDGRIKLSAILTAVQAIGYRAYPFDSNRQEELFRKERNTAIRRLAIAGLGMMQVMMYAIPVYIAQYGGHDSMGEDIRILLRMASLLLTTPVVFYSAWPFFQGAWRDLKRRHAGMDVPVALGVGSAYLASLYGTLVGSSDVYFDSITMFVFFLLTGRFLEMSARKRSAEAAETLVKLIPAAAVLLPDFPHSRTEELVAAVKLAPGDVVLVSSGESFPADGTVEEGISSVDESLLTGESHPVDKHVGSSVIGGSINQQSPLLVRVEKVGADTVLSAIVRLLDRALAEKPRIALLADQVASWFVLGLLILATIIAVCWYFIDPSRVVWITVSVLVVTCPCALSLATPAALTAALGQLTRLGLLSTRGHALETLARATDFVFDKTGTLTSGTFQLLDMRLLRGNREHALKRAAALEQGATHPIAQVLREAADHATVQATDVHYLPGLGTMGVIDAQRYRLGSPEHISAQPPADFGSHSTVVGLADEAGVLAWFALGDAVRPQARQLINALRELGVTLHLFSGDRPDNVLTLARQLGIANARGGMRPEDKLAAVKAMQAEGAIVAMTGDGVNDAPVLAQAQVSIAIDQGAEAAQAAADMVLLSANIEHLADGVMLARKTQTIIRQNLAWAISYNLIAVPAAALGHVSPWLAGIGMSLSSLLVVLNAMRLSRIASR